MKKYFSQNLLTTIILSTIFLFSLFIPQASVQAQSSDTCRVIEALISAGVIPPQNAAAALAAFNCSTVPPVYQPLNIELISQDIDVVPGENEEGDYATGNFKFKVTPIDQDISILKSVKDSSIDLFSSGVLVGHPSSVNLTTVSDGDDSLDYYNILEGDSRNFTLSYVIQPNQGTGIYKARANFLQLKDLPDFLLKGFESENVYLQNPLSSSTTLFASEMYLVDTKPTYNAGEIIKYSVKAIASDGKPGDPSRNFNVQAWMQDAETGETIQVDGEYQSVNASYNYETKLWDVKMRAPSDTSKTYLIDSAFYCSRPNVPGGCSDRQIVDGFKFSVASHSVVTVISPNGGEIWQTGSTYTIKWQDNWVPPVCAPGLTCVIAPPVYSINLLPIKLPCVSDAPCPARAGLVIGSGVTGNNYAWKIPSSLAADLYSIRVCRDGQSGVCDTSDSYFKIASDTQTVKPTITLKHKSVGDSNFSSSATALVPVGTEIILQWESKNTTSCVASASPAASAWTGMKSINGLGSVGKVDVGRTYTLTCSGPGGRASSKIDVIVNGGEPPRGTTVTLGETRDGKVLSCDTKKVNLAWTPVPLAVYHNIRVDDKSSVWSTKGWCESDIARGDLCENGNTSSYRANFPVQAGHSYKFWSDTTDASGKVLANRSINFSVSACQPVEVTPTDTTTTTVVTPVITRQTVKLGEFTSGAKLDACTVRSVNLAWSKVSGATYYNVRVDDLSNPWGGKSGGATWCRGYDGDGDLCENGSTGTSRSGYSVQAGRSYKFWLDATDDKGANLSSQSVNFSVPNCPSAEAPSRLATVLTAWPSFVDLFKLW